MAGLLEESGIQHDAIHVGKKAVVLPGWFRPTKEWDLVAVVEGTLLATIEFKSQVGSFGNNFNNRAEEAIGNAADLNCAFREGAFAGSPRPWTGYFMLLEDQPGSNRPVGYGEPHFPVFGEFRDASYADRYRILCQKLVRERLYDAACLLLSNEEKGADDGWHREPSDELSFRRFATSLMGHASAFAKMRNRE